MMLQRRPCTIQEEEEEDPRGWGHSDIFIIRRLGSFFGFQNCEFQFFFFIRNINIFWGYKGFCGYFLGSSQNWTIFRGHLHAF